MSELVINSTSASTFSPTEGKTDMNESLRNINPLYCLIILLTNSVIYYYSLHVRNISICLPSLKMPSTEFTRICKLNTPTTFCRCIAPPPNRFCTNYWEILVLGKKPKTVHKFDISKIMEWLTAIWDDLHFKYIKDCDIERWCLVIWDKRLLKWWISVR